MTLPTFLDRVVDAAMPVLGLLGRDVVTSRLAEASVTLRAAQTAAHGARRGGFLLAANLTARLYPRIGIVAPDDLAREAEQEILAVNPRAEVAIGTGFDGPTLGYELWTEGEHAVSVFSAGWNAYVDEPPGTTGSSPAAPAALLSAALGVGELFRIVFAAELGARGRVCRQPGAFNLVTLGEPTSGLPVPGSVDVGRFRLAGAGAIGQAAARTLVEAGASGILVAVDPEKVSLSNLQRYVLTRDGDVERGKAELLKARLSNSGMSVVPVAEKWSVELIDGQYPTLVGLDTAEARIAVQASLPGPIYNAWTQPADVGWSRHERFGDDPCLACLYWPDHVRPSQHDQIAAAFRQHPLRILGYLVHHKIPVGRPLPPGGIPTVLGIEPPSDAGDWLITPLLDDIAAAAGVDVVELEPWRELALADMYQEGICGGALLPFNIGEAPREVLVPLAHQSAIAGIMLATEFIIANVPELRAVRPTAVEARYDALAGFPQVMLRPRVRSAGCICADQVFQQVQRERSTEGGDCVGGVTRQRGEVG